MRRILLPGAGSLLDGGGNLIDTARMDTLLGSGTQEGESETVIGAWSPSRPVLQRGSGPRRSPPNQTVWAEVDNIRWRAGGVVVAAAYRRH